MAINHIMILGAGPAGLSAALALARSQSSSHARPRITVLELREQPGPALGGTINLTPLALRYLDRLGVGSRLRPRGIPVRGIDILSLRTGRPLGRMWDGVDALRVLRQELVASLMETIEQAAGVELRYGVNVTEIDEWGVADGSGEGGVMVKFASGEELRADVLIGADGIHSAARRLVVEPNRKPVYSGKAVAYGFVHVSEPGTVNVRRYDGKQAVEDTTVISGQYGSVMLTFGTPDRRQLHLGAVMGMREQEGSREGWKARGDDDKAHVRAEMMKRFQHGNVAGLTDVVGGLEDWSMYPVYTLPPGGRWSKGRVLLIGDAAHAMPPQGESTGLAIEDGVLLARVLSRHGSRSVEQLIADYVQLRQNVIDKVYKETLWRWQHTGGEESSWVWGIVVEWMSMVFLSLMSYRKEDYFASDVEQLKLPE